MNATREESLSSTGKWKKARNNNNTFNRDAMVGSLYFNGKWIRAQHIYKSNVFLT